MHAWITEAEVADATPLIAVDRENFSAVVEPFGDNAKRWCAANAFAGEAGRFLALPGSHGAVLAVLAGCDPRDALFGLASGVAP